MIFIEQYIEPQRTIKSTIKFDERVAKQNTCVSILQGVLNLKQPY